MKKKLVAVLAIIGIIVVGDLLYFLPAPQPAPVESNQTVDRHITVEIRAAEPGKTYTLPCEMNSCQWTPFTALQKIGEGDTIGLQFKTYDGLGVMVTDLAGLKNGLDNKYWVYEVNGQKVPTAADTYDLQAGDTLVWKFVTPE